MVDDRKLGGEIGAIKSLVAAILAELQKNDPTALLRIERTSANDAEGYRAYEIAEGRGSEDLDATHDHALATLRNIVQAAQDLAAR
ncbi:hypothetical protein [uncultured Sphingomonas sp.]|uniref:hypothetical protein n=1 Tax=uncultured Sphingomonas sp. TaxID=158754 RepID=UPI0025D23BF1|nr:hypothetical protein [uncultured Sphingomonas sp.]